MYIYIYIYIDIYIFICIHTYIFICIYTCVYTYICVHICFYSYLTTRIFSQWLRNAPEEPGGGPDATKQALMALIDEEEEQEIAPVSTSNGNAVEKPKSARDAFSTSKYSREESAMIGETSYTVSKPRTLKGGNLYVCGCGCDCILRVRDRVCMCVHACT